MHAKSYIITGPTASGKSWVAHKLAMRINGTIINCDSVQIYSGIENISASPFAGRQVTSDIDGVPYRLFSVLDLDKQISVMEYLNLARGEYDAAIGAGRVPIFVGGTGYYVNAIINGISPIPDVSLQTRMRAREMVMTDIALARKMLPTDFVPTDPQRVARALEVFLQTGKHITEFQKMPRINAILPTPRRILVNPPLDVLRERIALRVPEMVADGAWGEGRRIIAAGWDTRRAIGAPQACAYIRGEITMEQCIENWITKTNQYAKRQRTWFRTQFCADVEIPRVPRDEDVEYILNQC
ncbi:MAG: tRNA (adenosine(37)-N6)-dimethylallyltransferase MiaA [Alphaproteobacteria bacterium]|nr:tRNA (adenosine(37)-N6)-dimethylallyltransferase MiaA [Alphaproteobacteria bacterium]